MKKILQRGRKVRKRLQKGRRRRRRTRKRKEAPKRSVNNGRLGRINKEMVGSEEVITKDRESNSCKDTGKEKWRGPIWRVC